MLANSGWRVEVRGLRGADEASEAREVSDLAHAADGVAPLSEHSLLHLLTTGSRHVLAHDGDRLVGYAQVWANGAAEVVVAPDDRRRGLGTELWQRARSAGAERAWAHGDLPAASALARREGLVRVRELHKMALTVSPADEEAVDLPAWVTVSSYAERLDPAEWVALNAAAFAHHPEQGSLTVADFEARAAEPWFDPTGLLYLLDANAPSDAPPVAFHWTKRASATTGWAHGGEGREASNATGEVYAVGIDPAYQGRGLAGPLTRLGIAHLAGHGVTEVELYVDGDNEPALRTYRRAGFRTIMVDVVHAVPDATAGAPTVRMEP